MMNDPRLQRQVEQHPYPLLFATISGAHLYGFPSLDSDYDLQYARLRAELEQAYQECKLPEVPGGASALHDLLVHIRLGKEK